ncbi:MAG: imidazoleglycerol-phosphate dehydratase HisB [Clostridia bacterium]|nr:imidazoleglycerol-phosphate dehydratase HisB [Clostridia bacterium]
MRKSQITRNTAETQISLCLSLDGRGTSSIDTGCGFLDHMLTLFSKHGRFDLDIKCTGDTDVDYHHTVEDIGIALGTAFKEALGDMRGINRYADIILPMDESLILCAVDISGRSYLGYDAEIPAAKIGDFDSELVEEFLLGFVRKAEITLHIKKLSGTNSHHIAEGIFKALSRVLGSAAKINQDYKDEIPSTKGVL